MNVTIHQPEYLIWLGLLGKIAFADLFVILDTVQYKKENFQNRNRIRTLNSWSWLTVPIKKMPHHTLIKDIHISYDRNWANDHIRAMYENYKKSRYINEYIKGIECVLRDNHSNLSDLNISLIKYMMKCFSVKTEILISSQMNMKEIHGATEVNLEICKMVGAEKYIAGPGSRKYLNETKFSDSNIEVLYYDFNHPVYNQLYNPFIPNMSSVDLLFNYGEEGVEIFNKSIN